MMHHRSSVEACPQKAMTIAGKEALLALHYGVPDGAQGLIWETFFASRSRGIDWATHLPWANDTQTLCAAASIAGRLLASDVVVAALLIRLVPASDAAMIGYVCVDQEYRGFGLSQRMIDLASVSLRDMGVKSMLLWTGKPRVYESAGFFVCGQERRLTLRRKTILSGERIETSRWPSNAANKIGLPPFATAGWQAKTSEARIVFVDTPMGAALLDQTGEPDAILRLMFAVRHSEWSVTLEAGHPLYRLAVAHDACIDDVPGPVTMHRSLGDGATPLAHIPLAFRI